MSEHPSPPKPPPEEVARWQRGLAAQANNRAWSLTEQPTRGADEDEEMLQAAHAAMHFWKIVGDANQKAHAAQLVAHAYACLRLPGPASHYLAKSAPVFMDASAAPWEQALAHAVAANVAAASNDTAAHAMHHREARARLDALADPEDRAILEKTFAVLPRPSADDADAPMKPSISFITLGVDDLERAVAFYRDGLGWPTKGIVGTEFEHGAVAFFKLATGQQIALWPRASLAHDTGMPLSPPSATEFALAHNVGSKPEVDRLLARAQAAGARLVKAAQPTFYGGYAGWFQDPEGHLWELAWNPKMPT